ncbi:hypothetical protein CK203_078843 [Vitis vinifera]|uniref:Transcriptional coactivator Hfi1/Transcriptional adapter 1 n=1 Tax=Vitis vinifera TaxID=29760 RepID=A0A438FBT6_VITVI|nr:hypothetical protein CK203_078843 [Vitis vinifera]
MLVGRNFSRIHTLELKIQIEKKLGRAKAEKYFDLLTKYLSLKLSKNEFNKLCIDTIGRENVLLHNQLIGSIIKNACLSKSPPPKQSKTEGSLNVKVANGYQRSSLQSICRDVFPQSPRKGRTPSLRDRKFRDRPSPLGPHGKNHSVVCEDTVPKIQEQQSATELLSLGSRPPGEVNSVEDGEEVEQAARSPGIHSRSPVTAPLGIPKTTIVTRKVLCNEAPSAFQIESCQIMGELPDTHSLRNSSRSGQKHLSQKHGHVVPGPKGMWPVRYVQKPAGSIPASILDFRVAMELNPYILGEDWPVKLEKVCLRASGE